MNAEASTHRTRCRSSSSTPSRSRASSLGLWIRLTAYGRAGISAAKRVSARSIRPGSSPAAPKDASTPARASAITSSSEAMPPAIAPAMYACPTPWRARKAEQPSRSGGSGPTAATIRPPGPGAAFAAPTPCPVSTM
ncbi:hypothetical protein [Streptomyces albogriseolus]